MTAKEAYERSRGITAEVDSIIATVKLLVKLGEYRTVIDSKISTGARRKLEEMGYRIKGENTKIEISWNHFL